MLRSLSGKGETFISGPLWNHYDGIMSSSSCLTVKVPPPLEPLFKTAEKSVAKYFSALDTNPCCATFGVKEDRYILIRGSTLTVEFGQLMVELLGNRERGKEEAISFMRNLLFDLAHAIGKTDSRRITKRMGITDPLQRLSMGPVCFAFTGWGKVEIFEESSVDCSTLDSYCLVYDHPFSFEADAYKQHKESLAQDNDNDSNGSYDYLLTATQHPVCFMNAGYSSGWCEASFGLKLVAIEILCQARGDPVCRFIMAHPNVVLQKVQEYKNRHPEVENIHIDESIPGFFERRTAEKEGAEKVQRDLDTLKTEHIQLAEERQKVLDVLHCVLPDRVAQKLATGEGFVAERREATILFCDIVGFTTLSTRLSPEDILSWLNDIFSMLDVLCEKHEVEKIKTIGDAYMCCTGLLRDQPDHVERMARFALELREAIHSFAFRTPDTKEPISMRIGMHTGLCVSGIIGKSRLMFDIYGDSVNIASRMESHGVPGEVQCTEAVYRALWGEDFEFKVRTDGPEFKGIGFLTTYFLLGSKKTGGTR